jgi:enoyl-CoA hydratase/carnithine racemase
MADEESVRTRHKDGILTVTINRPHRKNAVDGATWDGLREAFRNAGADPGVRVLVLTGAGGDFCAGADLSSDREQQHPLHRMRASTRLPSCCISCRCQTKALLNESNGRTLIEALDAEARTQSVNFATEDTAVAFQAFRDKTEASFTGNWAVRRP